jgi:hypothetical protein
MKKYLLSAFLLLLVSSIFVKGQQPLVGLIQGTVVDQKQARIPYATLTATNIDSVEPESHRRTTSADENGFFNLSMLPRVAIQLSSRRKVREGRRGAPRRLGPAMLPR